MKLPFGVPLVVLTRQVSAVILSIAISGFGLTISPMQSAFAVGVETNGGTNVTGGISSDCSDSGMLVAVAAKDQQRKLGNCPLQHTDVNANVSGYVARVTVKQQFHNPFKEKIEAVYTFPLPENAAVDEMTMKVGNRVIKGSIKKKEEAREIYDTARAQGHVASLLDQERPNIFTQSVANIEPGQNIDIEIKYVNLLKYEDGSFTFAFPTVVGPRFMPGAPTGVMSGTGIAQDTSLVPDASKISPPVVAPGQRSGHDIAINLNINAGVPIQSVQSKLHEVIIDRKGTTTAHIKLRDQDKIPNRDFIATWSVAADSVQSGYLTHRRGNDGFFTLMLIPPKKVTPQTVQPKEMIFVIDCSGSQAGLPIKKAKETMDYILEHMNPNDTFQIITFNNGVTQFSDHPEVASMSMRESAHSFINQLEARGGTWMQPAIERACAMSNDSHRLRIITFMTDGYVGNDMAILGLIKKYRGKSRWFSFGTGNSVNRLLIDGIAREGGGEADYVLLNSSAEEVGKKFYDRISSPVLTDIKVEFEGVETKEVFPKDVSDLWAQRPLYFEGRYTKPGTGEVVLTGYSGGKPYKQKMHLDFPAEQDSNEVLPSIWARAKVDRLMHEDWQGMQFGTINPEMKNEVVDTALKYHIMSQFTSFVAVEEDRTTSGDKAKQVAVPVEMPQGVAREAVFGYAGGGGAPASVHGRLHAKAISGSGGGYGWSSGPVSLAAPAPVRAGASYGSSGGGLPPTNMGKFVHQPGNNQYAPGNFQLSWGSGSGSGSVGGSLTRSAGGSLAPPPPLPGASPSMPAANANANADTDFGPYMADLQRRIKRNWFPPRGQESRMVSVLFRVDSNGKMTDLKIDQSAGIAIADKAALEAATNAAPFRPLPAGSPDHVDIKFTFDYNVFTGKLGAGRIEQPGSSGDRYVGKIDTRLAELLKKMSHEKSKLNSKPLLVSVELTDVPGSDLLERLKSAGLDIVKRNGKIILGKIDPKKIDELSKLLEVIHIKLPN